MAAPGRDQHPRPAGPRTRLRDQRPGRPPPCGPPGAGGARAGAPHTRAPHSPAPQQRPAPRRPPLQLPPPLRARAQRRPQRRRRPARPSAVSAPRDPIRSDPTRPGPALGPCPSPSAAARRQHRPGRGPAAAPAGPALPALPAARPGPAGGAGPERGGGGSGPGPEAGTAPGLRRSGRLRSRSPQRRGCRAEGSLWPLCLPGAGETGPGMPPWGRRSCFSLRCLRRFSLFPTPSKGARALRVCPTARGIGPLLGSGHNLELFPSALAVGTKSPGSAQSPRLEAGAGPARCRVPAAPPGPRQSHLRPRARQSAAAARSLRQHRKEFVGIFDGEGNLPCSAAVGAAGLVPRAPSAAGSRQDQLSLRSGAVLQNNP